MVALFGGDRTVPYLSVVCLILTREIYLQAHVWLLMLLVDFWTLLASGLTNDTGVSAPIRLRTQAAFPGHPSSLRWYTHDDDDLVAFTVTSFSRRNSPSFVVVSQFTCSQSYYLCTKSERVRNQTWRPGATRPTRLINHDLGELSLTGEDCLLVWRELGCWLK